MPPFLPRELGEQGALRVSTIGTPRSRPETRRKLQRWIRDEFGERALIDKNARDLRQANKDKIALSRTQRPARVS